jgi:hypothetical protein
MKRALVILLALALLAVLGFWLLTSLALQRAGLERMGGRCSSPATAPPAI